MAQPSINTRHEAIVSYQSKSRDEPVDKRALDPRIHVEKESRTESPMEIPTIQSKFKIHTHLLSQNGAAQFFPGMSEIDTEPDGFSIKQALSKETESASEQVNVDNLNNACLSRYIMPVFQPKKTPSLALDLKHESGRVEKDCSVIGPLHERSKSLESESSVVRKSPLTLSAFRRPEETVRIADPDLTRNVHVDYDLYAPSCGILGHGARSTVRLAVRRKDQVKVAIKCVAKYDALRSRRSRNSCRSLDEWEILKQLKHHPNVVSLIDVYETEDEIQLVTKYCRGGELFDAIQRKHDGACSSKRRTFSELQGARITFQILSVLKDLHRKSIVHRDVKPENILLTSLDDSDVNVKLCDFGLARVLMSEGNSDTSSDDEDSPMMSTRSRAYSTAGSNLYAAPEVCIGSGYDTSADIYSLGVTLYVVLSGIPPSYFDTVEDSDSLCVTFPAAHWMGVSTDAKDLIRLMLDPSPEQRISAEEALKHHWIVESCVKDDKSNPGTSAHSRAGLFSPSNPRPVIDLELVRTRLYKDMDILDTEVIRKLKHTDKPRAISSRKRPRRSSSPNFAEVMVDLLEGMADSITAAAAGVVYNDVGDDIHVNDSDCDDPFSSCGTFLSVSPDDDVYIK